MPSRRFPRPPAAPPATTFLLSLLLPVLLLWVRPAGAQQLRVDGARNLDFGTIIPGVPTVISPVDALRAGRFEIVGAANAGLQIVFSLPEIMMGPRGSSAPLVFAPNAAAYSASRATGALVPFDPRTPFTTRLAADGRGAVFLGGALHPTSTQTAGAYGATVTITIIPTGT